MALDKKPLNERRDEKMDRVVDRVEESSRQSGRETARAMRNVTSGPETEIPMIGPIPRRLLIAVLLFVVVTTVVYLALWSLLGGVGLFLGWIPGVIAGLYAVKKLGEHQGPATGRGT